MREQGGFSLSEMLIVSAIVAILLTLGVPSYRYITLNYRMSAEVNGLLGDLQFARYEAIKEGQPVTVCSSSNGTTCSGSAAWQNGWVIFSNPQLAAQPPVNSILRIQGAFGSVVLDTFNANSGIGAVTYNREGFATTAAGFPNTTFFLNESTANGAYRRCLLLTPQGVPTTATHAINPALCP